VKKQLLYFGFISIALATCIEAEEYILDDYKQFRNDLGQNSTDEVQVISGPEVTAMNRGGTPGRVWNVSLGGVPFKISIENACSNAVSLDFAKGEAEKIPQMYWKSFEVVSDPSEDGMAYYDDIGGAAAHGGKSYLNMVKGVGAYVIIHEAGHILEQYAKETYTTISEDWPIAISNDAVSISRYGDRAHWEDLAEYARTYALALEAGMDQVEKLEGQTPNRFVLWEKVLRYSKAAPTNNAPTLAGQSNIVLYVAPYTVTYQADAIDEEAVYFNVINLPTNATMSTNLKELTIDFSNSPGGIYDYTVQIINRYFPPLKDSIEVNLQLIPEPGSLCVFLVCITVGIIRKR